jgi:hypothetical protein
MPVEQFHPHRPRRPLLGPPPLVLDVPMPAFKAMPLRSRHTSGRIGEAAGMRPHMAFVMIAAALLYPITTRRAVLPLFRSPKWHGRLYGPTQDPQR